MSVPPVPCAHCGNNFMRRSLDPNAPRLCNNCEVREEKRNPKEVNSMETVNILITCLKEVQIKIEEHCINQGISFSDYFIGLHNQKIGKEVSDKYFKKDPEEVEENEFAATSTTGMPDKFYKAKSKSKKD